MARQKQDEKLDKTFHREGLTFYNREGVWLVKRKSSLKSKRVKKSKAFSRTRENANEFALCSEFGRLVRLVLREAVAGVNGKHQNRLAKLLYSFRDKDIDSIRGGRRIEKGLFDIDNLNKLRGFVFDEYGLVNDLGTHVLAGSYVSRVVNFIPVLDLSGPNEATHFEFISVVGQINLLVDSYKPSQLPYLKNFKTSGKISVLGSAVLNLTLSHDLSVFQDNSGNWLFNDDKTRLELSAFAIRFYREISGVFYPLKLRGTFSELINVSLGNDLVVIEVSNESSYQVLHNLGHIPFVWLLDENKILSEALILHSSQNEFSIILGVHANFTICYYKRMGVEIPFSNTDNVIVTHNLGRYVAPIVLDELGRVCGSQITFTDLDSFEVRFGGLFSGKVIYYP